MKKVVSLIFITAIVLSLQAQNQKLRVAVFDPTTSGIAMDEGTKLAVQELISSTFVNTGRFIVVERSMIDKIMKEQAFQNSDFADNSQATEVGKLAGASKIVLSAVSLVGGRNMLSIKIIDVQTATVDQQKTKIVNTSDLLETVEPLTLDLLGEQAVYKTGSSATYSTGNRQINADYTVLADIGLMVLNQSMGAVSWYEAKKICENLNKGGFSDWYMPSKIELAMVLKQTTYFQRGPTWWYWSSTEIDTKIVYNLASSRQMEERKYKNAASNCICVRKINP